MSSHPLTARPFRFSGVRVAAWRLLLAGGLPVAVGCSSNGNGPAPAPPLSRADASAVDESPATSRPATTAATGPAPVTPVWVEPLRAYCPVPAGWHADPLKTTPESEHLFWVSPTGSTAYGGLVVRNLFMGLASDDRILTEFLQQMKVTDGTADLLEKTRDPKLARGIGGLQFKARGGRYLLRGHLVSSGTRVWIMYSGTLVSRPEDAEELKLAEKAKNDTVIEPAAGRKP